MTSRPAAYDLEPTDPTLPAAASGRWRRWASELGHYDKDRIAEFGGFIAGGFLLGVVCLYVFGWLAEEVIARQTTAMDALALDIVRRFSSPTMDVVMRALSFMGSEAVLGIGALVLTLFLVQRRWGVALMLILVTGGVQMLNSVLKTVFHRTRPAPILGAMGAQEWSFPSGHAMLSAAFYLYMGYIVWRLVHGVWRVVLLVTLCLLVLLIGGSRVYLQAHYPSDVIAGYLAGFVWTQAIITGSHLLITRGVPRLPGEPRRRPVTSLDETRAG